MPSGQQEVARSNMVPLILSKRSECQDGRGYLPGSLSLRGTTNDGLRLCSRRPIPSPQGEPIRIWCIKPRLIPPLAGTSSAPPTGRILPGSTNLNKALYCLILWLIGISSSVEPMKTFHQQFRCVKEKQAVKRFQVSAGDLIRSRRA